MVPLQGVKINHPLGFIFRTPWKVLVGNGLETDSINMNYAYVSLVNESPTRNPTSNYRSIGWWWWWWCPNLYKGKWLAVSSKNTSIWNWLFGVPGTSSTIEILSTPPVEKDQLRVDLSSNPANDLPVENWKQVPCTAGKLQKKTCCLRASKKYVHGTVAPVFVRLKASFLFLARLHKDSKRRVFRIAWCLWSPQRNQRLPKHWTLRRGFFFPKQRVPWPNCMACIILGFQ